ncbi:hypothetical protein AB0D04_41105 [Streptomyces sp. NPDC048483]|uniref:hypothetical protein n=1 Tax=Streptomyces sp. NPDC048483 TaxID=3154927 RepID=UPI0034413366
MTLYRATDAEDTMNMVSMLIAAFCQRGGMRNSTLGSYLQLSQQRDRAAGPGDGTWAHLAGLQYFNDWADKDLDRHMSYKAAGADLPVFRLSTGTSLVACTYQKEYRVAGVGTSGTVQFEKGSDTDVLLGGGGREWRSVRETSSVTALIEVPAKKTSPATVLACDCYQPQVLSATGVKP